MFEAGQHVPPFLFGGVGKRTDLRRGYRKMLPSIAPDNHAPGWQNYQTLRADALKERISIGRLEILYLTNNRKYHAHDHVGEKKSC